MNILLPLFLFMIPIIAAIVPRGIAALIDAFGLICGLQLFLQRRQIEWRHVWSTLRWAVAALAFIALSSFWSISPRALEMLRDTSLVSVAAMLIFTASHLWPQPLIDRALRWFLVVAGLSFAGFMIHALLGYPLNLSHSHINTVESLLGTNIPKRTVALFALLMWPAALCLHRFYRRSYATVLLLIVTMLLMGLPSRAAMLGALLGLATFGLATISRRTGRTIGLVILPLAMPLMLAIALCLPRLPHDWAQQLPLSGAFRLEIWHFTAHKALIHLPLGIGIDGSRTLAGVADKIEAAGAGGTSLLPDHPHNVYLQLWLEGGLVGAAFTIGLSWLLWQRLRRLPPRLQPFIWGYVTTATITLAIAYGTWQAWWLGGHLLAAFLLALLCRAGESRPHDGPRRQSEMAAPPAE